jgi:hypothetical protein
MYMADDEIRKRERSFVAFIFWLADTVWTVMEEQRQSESSKDRRITAAGQLT